MRSFDGLLDSTSDGNNVDSSEGVSEGNLVDGLVSLSVGVCEDSVDCVLEGDPDKI